MLVHGVGFGPATMAPLARRLEGDHDVVLFERRGYGGRSSAAPAASVAEHVDDLVCVLDEAGVGRARLVGVSGGATIALAAALARPDRVEHAVAHEPAVGSLAPDLRVMLGAALWRGGALALLELLAGPVLWSRVTPADRDALRARDEVIAADARGFLAFEPDLPEGLAAAALTCTVGEHSGPVRMQVAERLRERTGAVVMTVPGAGHLAHMDAPRSFAQTIGAAFAHDDEKEPECAAQ